MKRFFTIFLGFILVSVIAVSQNREPREMYLDPPTNDFQQIQQMMEQYFEGKDKGRGSGFKQWKRWEYFHKDHLTPDGKITNWSERAFDEYHRYLASHLNEDQKMITNGSWSLLGPTSWTPVGSGHNGGLGLVGCVAFHPTLANTVYIGTPAGGLYRTTNGGTSWIGLTDGLPSIGVSGIAVSHTNANHIYILTGDGDGGDTDCIGVLKSTNGGETWLSTGLSFTLPSTVRGYKLVMSPSNSSILMAVTTAGIFRTTNAGATWNVVGSPGSYRDIEYKPGDANTVYAVTTSSFYKSVDGGVTWTIKTTGVPIGETRSAIAVSPANPLYVYMLAGPATATGVFKGVYRSFDSGETTFVRSTTPNILGYSSTGNDSKHQTTYDLAMCVSNTSVGTILTGGINVWRSTDFGVTMNNITQWNNIGATQYTHADIHALEVNPHDNSIWCGSDGGIYKSTDDGLTWVQQTSNIAIMQFYDIAITEANTSLVLGGTQDNGTNLRISGSSINHIEGGDGFDCLIDHSNSNVLYLTANDLVLKSTNGGTSVSNITPPTGSGGSNNLAMNPSNSSIIYCGDTDVNKSINGGSTWTNMGSNGNVALEVGTNNTSRIYATSGSAIQMSNDAAVSWSTITGTLPVGSASITDIAINPDNSPEVWVSMSGYSAGNKVFRSGNAGTTWVNYSGSLPNVPILTIVFEDNNGSPDDAVFVGTDVGVFYRDATLGDWIPFSNWLPNVPVKDLQIHQAANLITAGTHGRGLWRSATYTDCPPTWTLSGVAAAGYSYYQASDWISSSRTINGGIGAELHFKAANSITLTDGFWAHANSEFDAVLGACGTGIPIAPGVPLIGTYAGPMPGVIEQTVDNELVFKNENTYLIYPNPFNNFTTIEYSIEGAKKFSLYVTDIYGKLVRTLVEKQWHPKGTFKVNFDGSALAAGMYFCHFHSGKNVDVKKIVLEK